MYDLSGELNVILITIWSLRKSGNLYNSLLHLVRQSPFTFIGSHILLKTFLSNILTLLSSLLLIAQVSHPYSKHGLIFVLYSFSSVFILVQRPWLFSTSKIAPISYLPSMTNFSIQIVVTGNKCLDI